MSRWSKKKVLLVKGCLDACVSHHFVGLRFCDWSLPGTSNINLMVEYSIELDIFHVESCFSQFDTFVFIILFWLLLYKNLKLCEIFWICIIWSVCWWCGVEDFFDLKVSLHLPYPAKIGYRPCQGWYTCNFEVCSLILQTQFWRKLFFCITRHKSGIHLNFQRLIQLRVWKIYCVHRYRCGDALKLISAPFGLYIFL